MNIKTLITISAAMILMGLILIGVALITGCSGCRPTADPARIRAMAQSHSLTALNLAETVALECERQF